MCLYASARDYICCIFVGRLYWNSAIKVRRCSSLPLFLWRVLYSWIELHISQCVVYIFFCFVLLSYIYFILLILLQKRRNCLRLPIYTYDFSTHFLCLVFTFRFSFFSCFSRRHTPECMHTHTWHAQHIVRAALVVACNQIAVGKCTNRESFRVYVLCNAMQLYWTIFKL